MVLTGQAKIDYQREYMREYRKNGGNYRFRIFQRDGFRCQYCGRTPTDGIRLEVDHIRPRCEGGEDVDSNRITACSSCNGSKGGKVLDYDAEQGMMDRIEQLQGLTVRPKPQSHRPMMAGYVPPKETG